MKRLQYVGKVQNFVTMGLLVCVCVCVCVCVRATTVSTAELLLKVEGRYLRDQETEKSFADGR